jgi:uncharacterized protein with von Willebrand factor type A (vWA) domain
VSPGPPATHPVDVVVRHPLVRGLGADEPEQSRAEAFARDLARWLVGRPHEELSPLARVVTLVAQREFRPTRRLCEGRPLMAVEAAARATAALWPLLRGAPEPAAVDEEDEEPPPDEQGAAAAAPAEPGGDEDGGPDPLEALLGGEGHGDDPDLDALIAELARQVGAGGDAGEQAAKALDEVSQAAADGAIETEGVARRLERFVPGIGWSEAPGALHQVLLERLDELATLLTRLSELDALADALGRLEDASRKDGRRDGGREEVAGVRLSGEVAHALPAELALLSDPDTEDLFFQRWLDKRLVSLELTGRGDEGRAQGDRKGPVIACIDTSASMEGAPELAAKALVLAVCRRMIPRGRPVHLLLFGGPGERTEIRLRKGRGGLEALLDFLLRSFHSGTDFDGPLLRAMELLEEQELDAADVLVVTDGLCRAAPAVVDRVAAVRAARGVRVWSIVLGNDDVRGVAPFSDEVLPVDPARLQETAPVLGRLRR